MGVVEVDLRGVCVCVLRAQGKRYAKTVYAMVCVCVCLGCEWSTRTPTHTYPF